MPEVAGLLSELSQTATILYLMVLGARAALTIYDDIKKAKRKKDD
jgi:hypothetical protein